MKRLEQIARAIHGHQQVSALVRNPDPEPTHDYERSIHSGVGNCHCGGAERDRRHPHTFLGADSDPTRCTCGLPPDARCHAAARGGAQ